MIFDRIFQSLLMVGDVVASRAKCVPLSARLLAVAGPLLAYGPVSMAQPTINTAPSPAELGNSGVFGFSILLIALLVIIFLLYRKVRLTEDKFHVLAEDAAHFRHEVIHRVSNNLQVLLALLRMERRHASVAETEAIDRLIDRTETMAALQQQFDPGDTQSDIPAIASIKLAAAPLRRDMTPDYRLDLHVDEMMLPIDKAFKISLLISEIGSALCQGLKSAHSPEGTVRIALSHQGPEHLALTFDSELYTQTDGELELPSHSRRLVDLLIRDLGAGALQGPHLSWATHPMLRLEFPRPQG